MKYIGLLAVLLLVSVSCASFLATIDTQIDGSAIPPTLQAVSSEMPDSPADLADVIFYKGDVISLEEQGVVQSIAIKDEKI